MRRDAVWQALAQQVWLRNSICAGMLAAFWTPSAYAADAALLDPIGFSQDGTYFAFEEYGVEDGSGFAYSSIYIIDLPRDSWVVGSPFQAKAIIEGMALQTVRAEADESAHQMLLDLDISIPPQLIAANGDGTPAADGRALRFGMPAFGASGVQGTVHDLSLSTFVAAAGSPCADWFSQAPLGFSLHLHDDAGGAGQLVFKDKSLPLSRGCPADYQISAIYAPFQSANLDDAVALISVYRNGFEGQDRRFIALPLGLGGQTSD